MATIFALNIPEIPLTERPWILVGGILVGSYLLSRFIEWIGHHLLNRSDRWPDDSVSQIFLNELHTPLHASIILGGVYLSLNTLGVIQSSYYLVNGILSILIILWMRATIGFGSQWIEAVNENESKYEFSPVFKNFLTISSIVITLLFLLIIWEINVTPIFASAGVLSIIFGLAAQDAIGNLIGGVSLYFDDTYKTGDVILLEDDRRGTVTDIGIRSTTVLTRDNILITVPNSVLNSASVINESAPQRRKRIRVSVTAAYGTDHEDVEEILLKICDEVALILDNPAPQVLFREFGDSALVFELWAFVAHPFSEPRAVDQINRLVYEEFDEADIDIPFPQRKISYLSQEDDPTKDMLQTGDERVSEYSEEHIHGKDS